MIRNDYILRLIEMLGAFIARLMRQLDQGEFKQANTTLDAMSLQTVGLPLAVVENNPPDGIEALLEGAIGPDHPRIMAAAIVLDLRGQIAYREVDEISAFRLWTNAVALLITSTQSSDEEVSERSRSQLESVLRQLLEFELPSEIHRSLATHYERTGELSRSEDHLYDALKDQPDRIATCRSFYQRLQLLSDAQLEQGNLNREEITQSMTELG